MIREYEATIKSISPLLQHNVRLANPLDECTKRLKQATSKRNKTEEDLYEIQRLEWEGGLYLDENGYPVITSSQVDACCKEGAKAFKLGKKSTQCVFCLEDSKLRNYGSNAKGSDLYQPRFVDVRPVVVNRARIFRTRPIFPTWEATLRIGLNVEFMEPHDLERCLRHAGAMIGIGDYRPRYGRFTVETFGLFKA